MDNTVLGHRLILKTCDLLPLFLLVSDATSQHGLHIMIRCTSYKIKVQWTESFVGPLKNLVVGPPKFSCSSRFGGMEHHPGKCLFNWVPTKNTFRGYF